MDEVEAVARAIKSASCPGREGPFGGYDYGHNEAFYGPAPEGGRYVIRDYRDPSSPDWGAWLHQTNDRDEHEAKFAKMTDDHVAQAAIAALDAARGDPVARVVEWLRKENYRAFTDGMEAAAQICGSLAEVEYDDADGFDAATGCEAAIMRVVKDQRREQAALGASHD